MLRIFFHGDMNLTLDLNTEFKVTAHPLTKGNLLVKYEPNWTKGKYDSRLGNGERLRGYYKTYKGSVSIWG